jgi:hypothetical protein
LDQQSKGEKVMQYYEKYAVPYIPLEWQEPVKGSYTAPILWREDQNSFNSYHVTITQLSDRKFLVCGDDMYPEDMEYGEKGSTFRSLRLAKEYALDWACQIISCEIMIEKGIA